MSLILDALNRAEHERKNQNTLPDLQSVHSPIDLKAAPNTRVKTALMVAVGGLVVVLSAAIILLLQRQPPAPVLAAQAPAAQAIAPVAPPLPAVQTELEQPSTAESVNNPVLTDLPAQSPAQSPTPAAVEQLYAAQDAEPVAVDSGVSELYSAEAAGESESIVDPFNAAADVNNVATTLATATLAAAPAHTFATLTAIPDFNDLPWNLRQQIPTISYARHNFLANGLSSVVINNQTSGVGNIIGAGQFVVQDIYVDGVVLKHGDTVFKLRALNGWINM